MKKFIIITSVVALVLIVAVAIFGFVAFFTKIVPFAPYVPKPPPRPINTFYCPNGCPDKDGNVGGQPINTAISQYMNANVSQYISGGYPSNDFAPSG